MLMLVAVLSVPIIIVLTKDLDFSTLNNVVIGNDGTEYNFIVSLFKAPAAEIASGLAWGLGYFGMPHILVRFMAIKKPSMVKKSSIVAIVWVVLALVSVIFIAVFGRVLVGSELLANDQQSLVFIRLARELFPAFIAGLLLSAIIAASMSTADSQLLVASSSFASDLYKPLIRKGKASDNEVTWASRIVVLIVAVVAFAIAASGIGNSSSWASNIMAMVENAWGLFGAAFGPVVILSLFWRRLNYQGAVAGIIGGAVVDILWLVLFTNTIIANTIAATGVYEIVPGFIIGAAITIIVSLLTKEPSAEVTKIFDAATSPEADEI
jgi:sodium/proline symporter